MGATLYQGASPQITAAILGTNEFSPGQDTTINVIVQNIGVADTEFLDKGTIDPDALPTTAKQVTVGLLADNAPVVVKSDPQLVGDILTRNSVMVPIHVEITTNATEGEYQIPLTVQYTWLSSSQQDTSEALQSQYSLVNLTIPLTINIIPHVKIGVLAVVPEDLNAGATGYIDLTIENMGSDNGREATVKIVRNGNSPIIPSDTSVFIGDFPSNATVSCRYKVAVSSDAENQTYPVDVIVTYENNYGDIVDSDTETVGVPVWSKLGFAITSSAAQVTQGSDQMITVEYQNIGNTTAYQARARISPEDPFSSSDDRAYLGDLKPGEQAVAQFKLETSSQAVVKTYALDSEIMYMDAEDNSQISDTIRVPVQVVSNPGTYSAVQILPIILIVLVAIAGYYVLILRKKK
jgi:hypothetical protein